MPLPIIILIVVAAAALTGGVVAVSLNWDCIRKEWRGKRVAVLGEYQVGKTSLIHFFTKGSIPSNYKATLSPKLHQQSKRLKLEELELKLDDVWDIPALKEARISDWRPNYENADIVFYLLKANEIIARNAKIEKRVKNDLETIRDWQEGLKSKGVNPPPLFIIGTHCDKDPDFANLSEVNKGDYYEKFRNLPVLQELTALGGSQMHPVRVILGSLLSEDLAEKLVITILMEMQALEKMPRSKQ